MPKISLISSDQIKQISRYLDEWITQVESHNSNSYFDINKDSENLSRQLLNIIFNLNLKNLNDSKPNFPHIDLGDRTNKIAFSVTSRVDFKKFKTDSIGFMEKHKDTFPLGIKFFILKKTADSLKKTLQNNKLKPYHNFNTENDILSIKEIKKRLPSLSHEQRNSILEILQKEIKTIPEEIDIDINVKNIDNQNIGRYNLNKNFDLNYKIQKKIDLIKITPYTQYFSDLVNKKIINYLGQTNVFRIGIQFPTLDIKINNNTNNAFTLKKIILLVKESKPINKPLILFSEDYIKYELTIHNEGWEKVSNASLHFNITNTESITSFPSTFNYKKNIPDIIQSERINLFKEILDFHLNTIKQPLIDPWDNNPPKYVYIIGILKFTANKKKQNIPFKLRICLCEGELGGGHLETSFRYPALLEQTKKNYEVPISTSESLKLKDQLRLSLLLSCYRHTKHNFKIRFEFTNYFQETKPIDLELFYPRYYQDEAYFNYLKKTEKSLIQKEIF
ncbi:MAG: SMEK domain-containing protein [Candidatus Gracilibacteria bacterium]|jgi:hypothetical protein|nr:SMEK domain-containing protein [Candidatus Gracilibacteria bacterium]